MSGWRDFWNRPNCIYVNDRHLAVHYGRVADDIIRAIPRADAVVLDYGCGEALGADRVAARAGRLYLCDSAPETRARLAARHGSVPGIRLLDEAGLAALPPGSLDLVVVNSVIQYLSAAELKELLVYSRGWLKPDGRLLLADVIPPDNSARADALCLLRTARANGFLTAAVAGLGRTFFSDYRRMRQTLGLSTYSPGEIEALAAEARLAATRETRNLGFNQGRMTFSLRPIVGSL